MKLRSVIIVAERRKTFKGDLVGCDKLGAIEKHDGARENRKNRKAEKVAKRSVLWYPLGRM
jgi:hypothetical protein